MTAEQAAGTIATVFLGNALSVWFFYAIFWGETQRKRGVDETNMPGWFYLGATIPPLLSAALAYFAFY